MVNMGVYSQRKFYKITGYKSATAMLYPGSTDVWYVNARKTSATTGDGSTWTEAFLTITEAVSAAVANDTILIRGTTDQDDGSMTSDYAEDVTIPATKMGLKIIGMGTGPEGVLWTTGAQNGTILTINAKGCYIANIRFRPNGSSSGKAILLAKSVTLSECANGAIIEDCIFRSTTETALSGIHTDGANDVIVRNCMFSSVVTAINQTSANNAITYRMHIENNIIDDKCTNGIVLDGRSCVIKNNDIATVGMTMIIQTDAVSATGQENIVTGHMLILQSAAYETHCSGTSTDQWNGNYCDDTGSSVIGTGADGAPDHGQITGYPQG